MSSISKHKQIISNNIKGDCMRTCVACLLNTNEVEDVPNFMNDGFDKYDEHLTDFLEENELVYIEIKYSEMTRQIPNGFCILVGKSPRGDYDHAIVGRVENTIKGEDGNIQLFFEHDPSPYGGFIELPIKKIGFLSKKL